MIIHQVRCIRMIMPIPSLCVVWWYGDRYLILYPGLN